MTLENSEKVTPPIYEAQRERKTFERLLRAHGPMLARYVRCRITNASDAEDVLQETLVAVWLGFGRLQDSTRMQAWLLRIAQNRCRDYFRAQDRCPVPLEEEVLQNHANRFGLYHYRQARTLTDVMEALDTAPQVTHAAVRQFYLEGMTIAEVATALQSHPGTVKRQLFQARHAARTFLGVPRPLPHPRMEKTIMTNQSVPTPQTAAEALSIFPTTRPEIRITELDKPPFAVDCQELGSWSIIPVVGERASLADYSLPSWQREQVSVMWAQRAAEVHDVTCVEIEESVWKFASGWQRPGTFYARLTETQVECLAVHLPHEDFTQVETFLDEWFALNWGAMARAVADDGLVTRAADGSLVVPDAASRPHGTGMGFGLVKLEISGKFFTCLRVLEVSGDGAPAEDADNYVTESYLTQEGRTVLVRRYCLRRFAELAQFPVLLDETDRLVINGLTFVHWYDTVTEIALSQECGT